MDGREKFFAKKSAEKNFKFNDARARTKNRGFSALITTLNTVLGLG